MEICCGYILQICCCVDPRNEFLFPSVIPLLPFFKHKGLWHLNACWLNGDGLKDRWWLRLRRAKGD